MLGQRHALAMLLRDHGALGRIRSWPGRHCLQSEVRGLNDHDLWRVVERDVASHRLMILEMPDAVTTVHVPLPPVGRPVMVPPPATGSNPQPGKDAAVVAMSRMDKVLAAVQRSGKYMGPALGNTFAQLFTADNLKILAAFIIAGALANTNPVTAAVFDSAMLIMVYYQAGSAGIDALELLVRTTMAVLGAKGEADLDRAGENYAKAFVGLGGAVFMAWLARRIIREKNPGGSSSPRQAAPAPEPPPRTSTPLRDRYLNEKGGRWGGTPTRTLNDRLATDLEGKGYTVTGGAGRASEEWIPGPGGGTTGGTFVDITATDGASTLRIQTVTTLADGVTPTPGELAAAARIRAAFPNDILQLVPKTPK